MTSILIFILIAIVIMAVVTVALLISGSNDIKCPKCGTEMEFMGNVIGTEEEDKLFESHHRHPAYKHLYRCPKCGEEYVI